MTTSNPTSNQSQPNNEQRLYKFNDIKGMERIEIKELNIQGCYTLKHGGLTNDKCTLCRQLLTSPSFEDMQNGLLNVQILIGKCEHCFHKSCFEAYQSKGNSSCPIDTTPWNVEKIYTFRNSVLRETEEPNRKKEYTSISNEKVKACNKISILP